MKRQGGGGDGGGGGGMFTSVLRGHCFRVGGSSLTGVRGEVLPKKDGGV